MWGMKEKREKEMSLRKQARILGISHTYLSMLVNGRRKWPEKLKARYEELVTTFVTTNDNGNRQSVLYSSNYGAVSQSHEGEPDGEEVVGGTGFEPVTSAMSTQRSKPLS